MVEIDGCRVRLGLGLGLGPARARQGAAQLGTVGHGVARHGSACLGLTWLGTKSLSGSHPFLNRFASGKSHCATFKDYIDAHDGWNSGCPRQEFHSTSIKADE
jgi:hypothetical protein